jgi:hypothetical protein
MIQRVRDALARGADLYGADAMFYIHELTESNLHGGVMTEEAQEAAHNATNALLGNSPFALYHPDVIASLPGAFNNWRQFWGPK